MSGERILGASAGALLGRASAASPFNWLFTGEDVLQFTSICLAGVVDVAIQGRIYTASGEIKAFAETHRTFFPASPETTTHRPGVGSLLNVTVFCKSAVPKRGQLFVQLKVVRGTGNAAVVLGTLLQGYVTLRQSLGWPGSPLESSLQAQGAMNTISMIGGGLGAEVDHAVNSFTRYRVQSIQAVLTADATVTTRAPALIVTDASGNQVARCPNPATLTAGLARNFNWTAGLPFETVVSAQANAGGLPSNLVVGSLFRLRTETANLQPGDQWSNPRMLVEEWVDGD